MRAGKAQPALFCLCNALKRIFGALSLLNWTQLSSHLRAQSRLIFPGKFSSKPHVRHSPDQAKRVSSPPLRLFRVRHCDPRGNRLISPRFFTPLCRSPSPAAPSRRRSFHQSASSWRLRAAPKTKTGAFNKFSTKTPFCGTSFDLLKRKSGFETAWKHTKSRKIHQTGGGRGCGKEGHAGPKRKTPVFKSPQIFTFGFQCNLRQEKRLFFLRLRSKVNAGLRLTHREGQAFFPFCSRCSPGRAARTDSGVAVCPLFSS